MCASCRLPARPTSGASSLNGPRRASRRSISKWAARTSSWSWTTRTSTWRSTAACGAVSARPASAARRPAASSSTKRSTGSSWSASSRGRAALRVGDGLDPETEMGPSISEGQLETVRQYVEIGRKEGARLACGGQALTSGPHAGGYFHEPTIFADVAADHAHRPGGDFRPGGLGDPVPIASRRRSTSATTSSTGCRRRSTRRT